MPTEHRLHARCGCGLAHSRIDEQEHHAAEASSAGRPFAFGATPRHFERDRPFAVEHLALDLTLDLDAKSVSGTASLTVKRVDPNATELPLDAIGFDLQKVTLDGHRVAHRYDGRVLTVTIPVASRGGVLAVTYSATPRRGLYFLEPDEHVKDRPRQVWSQCQEEDARHFLPCHDKPHVKMTTEMTVTVPNGFYVLSNGELASSSKPKEGPWRFHWKMSAPHPSYLLTLVAGEFAEVTAKAGGVPLSYLVPRGREGDVERTFGRTPQMIEYFGTLTGVAFPWNKYAQVVVSDFIFGGMENTTATTMYEHILLDERAALDVTSDDLVAHELAHQWFGDYVTCRDWSDGWLNEGFATFMEHVWREKHLGKDEHEYAVKGDLDAYMAEAAGRYRRPIVCHAYDAPLDLFDRHLYEKGGLVLHLLRLELGSDLFWRGVSVYLKRHAFGVVETKDLQRALEEVSGRSLGRLFDQWVYRPGHPDLEVAFSWERGILQVAVKQTHASTDDVPSVFEVPLHLDIVDAQGKVHRERLAVTQRTESFAIPAAERPAFVVVDPEMRVLGDISLRAPADMLRAQVAKAPTARGRWLAAHALAKHDDPTTRAALVARLEDEAEFWGVRATAAETLGILRGKESFAALAENAYVTHPKVRRAVVSALGRFRTAAAAETLRPLALRDASFLVEAEAARSLGKTKQASAFDTLVDVMDRPSWADVIRVGAIDGLAALRDDRAAPHVLSRLRYGHATRARRAAILAVPKLMSDRRGREALEELLEDDDPHLRIDVVRALTEYGDGKSRPALRGRLEVDLDPRVRRRIREALRDLGGEGKKSLEQLKEELERLQNEHTDLKARLAQIEARVTGEASSSKGNGSPPAAAKAGKGAAEASKSEKKGEKPAKDAKQEKARRRKR